ncbi:hypothetical protein V5799_019808 [Amblyomma americanum]|uniref:TIL domain-containing protein n=1 Tax=Amblyomma americanum TaxID=6943 RepID=A0AAQ4EVW0_AMBAM
MQQTCIPKPKDIASCPGGEVWTFCPREGIPNGRQCPEVWPPKRCAWLSIQCGCPLGKYQHVDGRCVKFSECHLVLKGGWAQARRADVCRMGSANLRNSNSSNHRATQIFGRIEKNKSPGPRKQQIHPGRPKFWTFIEDRSGDHVAGT